MKFIVATLIALFGIDAASAADLPARIYTKAPAADPAYDWSGFYIGINAGVGLGRNLSQLSVPVGGGTTYRETSHFGGSGAVGGGQIGANWQFGNWVLGLETDIQTSGIRDDRTCGLFCEPNGLVGAHFEQKLDWFGTARGRIGLASGPVLSYVTGGLAYGGVKTSVSEALAPSSANAAFSDTRVGWTIGSGVEAALGGNWTGKIEYLYLDLGTQSGILSMSAIAQPFSSEIREHIFRGGLNYRFGGSGGTAPQPVANWAGFYVGGNGGSGTAVNPSSLPGSTPGGPIVLNERFNLSPDGYLGGLQAGYNWQVANWVFGLEADIQGSTQKDDKACQFLCAGTIAGATYDQRLPWLGTARARIGYSVGSSLFYATGGLAYGEVKTSVVHSDGAHTFAADFSSTKTGWTVGAGLESPFNPFGLFGGSWTAKTEYLYVDLGKTSNPYTFVGDTFGFDSHVQEHIFRTGLNYHLNAPVIARY